MGQWRRLHKDHSIKEMKVEMKEDLIDRHVRSNTEMTKWKIEIGDQTRGDNNQKTTGQLTTAHHVDEDEDKGIGHKAEEE